LPCEHQEGLEQHLSAARDRRVQLDLYLLPNVVLTAQFLTVQMFDMQQQPRLHGAQLLQLQDRG
jgi:hypothetical protein